MIFTYPWVGILSWLFTHHPSSCYWRASSCFSPSFPKLSPAVPLEYGRKLFLSCITKSPTTQWECMSKDKDRVGSSLSVSLRSYISQGLLWSCTQNLQVLRDPSTKAFKSWAVEFCALLIEYTAHNGTAHCQAGAHYVCLCILKVFSLFSDGETRWWSN